MPIDEKELQKIIEPKWRHVLASMEKGKFYSLGEMSEKIVGRNVVAKDSLKQYLPAELRDKKSILTEDIQVALVTMSVDIANVLAFLHSQLALENIRQGQKDGENYFGVRVE
jgi:hypothetical protein